MVKGALRVFWTKGAKGVASSVCVTTCSHCKAIWSCGEAQSHGHEQLPSVTYHSSARGEGTICLCLLIQRIILGHVPILNQLTVTSGARSRCKRAMISLAWVRCPSWNINHCQRVEYCDRWSLDRVSISRPRNLAKGQGYIKFVAAPQKPHFAYVSIEKRVISSFYRVLGRQVNRPHYHII